MKRYITIDGGTTNTRASLVEDERLVCTVKIPIGARKCIGGNTALKEGLRDAVKKLLSDASLAEGDIEAIIASGMITSEFGLANLPHLVAPVGIKELHDGMETAAFPEISKLPIVFIRGVKTVGALDSTDMMRGEETELMGIMNDEYGKCVYVLPGSHSKLIFTDEDGRITHFSTMLTGEMLVSLCESTILKDAVTLPCEDLNTDRLEEGFSYAKVHGINEALFKTRILKNLFGANAVECYSFFLGVVLHDEIEAILRQDAETVVIGGKRQMKEAMAYLVNRFSDKKTVSLSDAEVDSSTSLGMIRVYEYGA